MTTSADINGAHVGWRSRRVAQGVAWSYSGAALVIAAQIAYTAFTARILQPSAFGAYASAQALIALMGYFSLATLGAALARRPALAASTVGTALYLATIAGCIAAAGAVLLSNVWAAAWDVPDAAPLIVLWAPTILLSALAAIPVALLRRRLRFAAAAGIEFVAPMMGFVVGAVAVASLRSPSALVIGQIANASTMLAVGLFVVRGEIALRFSKVEARSLLSFSGQVSGQNLAHYGFYTLPGFVIARTAGSVALGFFSRASLLVMLPMNSLTLGISESIYPVISQVSDVDARRRALSDVIAVETFLFWPALGILAGSASVAVDLLFGPGWDPVVAMIPPLCLFAAGALVYATLASATEAIGWLRVGWAIQATWGIALAVATLAAWQLGADARAYLYWYAATQIAIVVFQAAVLSRKGLVSGQPAFAHGLVGGSTALVTFAVAFAVSELLEGSSLLVRLVGAGAVALAFGATVFLALPRVPAGRALARRGVLPARYARRFS